MNSTAGSTPTVPKVLRVTELKNVLMNSLSGSGSMISSTAKVSAARNGERSALRRPSISAGVAWGSAAASMRVIKL